MICSFHKTFGLLTCSSSRVVWLTAGKEQAPRYLTTSFSGYQYVASYHWGLAQLTLGARTTRAVHQIGSLGTASVELVLLYLRGI
eukprot:315413-Amphidinium_carterae.1